MLSLYRNGRRKNLACKRGNLALYMVQSSGESNMESKAYMTFVIEKMIVVTYQQSKNVL